VSYDALGACGHYVIKALEQKTSNIFEILSITKTRGHIFPIFRVVCLYRYYQPVGIYILYGHSRYRQHVFTKKIHIYYNIFLRNSDFYQTLSYIIIFLAYKWT
jgi:hypothetical protein